MDTGLSVEAKVLCESRVLLKTLFVIDIREYDIKGVDSRRTACHEDRISRIEYFQTFLRSLGLQACSQILCTDSHRNHTGIRVGNLHGVDDTHVGLNVADQLNLSDFKTDLLLDGCDSS